jgi:hypothetical protein
MRKITVVGKDSAVKNAVIVSLNATFQVTGLRPDEVNVNNIGDTDLVIYVTESQPDRQIFELLCAGHGALILISRVKLIGTDLFVSIAKFQDFATKEFLKEIQSLRDFIDRFYSNKPGLSDVQQLVISQLSKSSCEKEALSNLPISRRTYYMILSELRALYGVSKNWQLIQLIQSMSQIYRG